MVYCLQVACDFLAGMGDLMEDFPDRVEARIGMYLKGPDHFVPSR